MNKHPISSLSGVLHWGALGIAGGYLILGGLWMLFSDQLAARVALNEEMLTSIRLYKGWGYVIITALLLYWLIGRYTAALRASQLQLHYVIDAMPAFISYVGTDRHYRFTNKAYRERYEENTEGKHIEEVLGKPAYQAISKYVDKVLAGETVSYETEIPFSGTELFMDVKYIPDIAAHGQVKGFFVMAQDKTTQRQVEEEQRLWADAFEGCAHGIAIDDPNTNRIVVCNPAFAKMHRSSVEDMVGSAILSLYATSDHEHVRRHVQKADQIGHARFEASMTRRGRDVSTFPVEVDVVSVLGDDGELLHRVVTAQDISERKRAEKILQESEERYRLVSELTSDYAYKDRVEEDGSIIPEWFTESFTRITGYTLEETRIPGFWQQLVHPEDIHIILEHIQNLLSGQPNTMEIRVITKNGELRWLRDYSNPIWDADQKRVVGLYGAVQNITERKQAEFALRASQEQLLSLINEAPISIAMFDREMRYLAMSQRWVADYGHGYEELVGRSHYEIHTNLPEEWKEAQRRGLAGETLKNDSDLWVDVDGTKKWLRWAIVPWHNTQGQIGGIIISAEDITKRVLAEEAVKRSEEQYRALIEQAGDGIFISDQNGKYIAVNSKGCAMLGYSQEELLGKHLSDLIAEEDRVKHPPRLEELQAGKTIISERRLICKDGSLLRVEISAKMLPDGRMQGIVRDITERKRAEKALQAAHDKLEHKIQERTAALSEANALLQALMDNIPDHIYFKDTQSRFIRNSRSQASLLGLNDPSEAVGKTDFDFFPHAARAYAEEQEIMRSGKPLVDFEEWVVWPDGREMWVSTTKMPLRDSEGQTIGIFGISRDITERKRAEQAIRRLNADLEKQAEQLQAANKELEAFSYSVSHDLRAPLRAIDGYTRILVEDYEAILDSEGKRICGVISREARRMGQLIDDLLAFSRLGRKELYSSLIDMKALAASVFDELLKEENPARIDFALGDIPRARGDSSLVRQVWVNLLSNAIKFTSKKERASIEVGSKQTKDEIIYYVRDNGAGFDMEYGNKLFGVFQRLHSDNEFSGTGVGLAIVQRIIRRHDGRVWAEGEVENGATFYFALPHKENLS